MGCLLQADQCGKFAMYTSAPAPQVRLTATMANLRPPLSSSSSESRASTSQRLICSMSSSPVVSRSSICNGRRRASSLSSSRAPALWIECNMGDFSQWKQPNPSKKKSTNPLLAPKEKKDQNTVRLPGGQQQPTYVRRLPGRSSPPGLGQFRPPHLPGSNVLQTEDEAPLDPSKTGEAGTSAESDIDTLLQQVKECSGSWQERAAAITQLQQHGLGAEELYDATFVSASVQTTMVVASKVYDSLVQASTSTEVLSEFDESTIDVLYALRTLSVRQRKAAAAYVVNGGLEVEIAQELARAIKEHERRPQGREGFTAAPGDCLAFMLHRAAGETRDAEQRNIFIQRGLTVALSNSAKSRFSEFD